MGHIHIEERKKHQASNYRPVSLTSIPLKILEHIVHNVIIIMKHLDNIKVF